jgi:uncharacterized repeat protein (TIGR01451 family)
MSRRPVILLTAMTMATAMAIPAASAAPEAPASDNTREKQVVSLDEADVTAAAPDERPAKFTTFGSGPGAEIYLIRLQEPPVPTHAGEVAGQPSTAPEAGERLDPTDPAVRQYREHLVEEQVELIERIERIAGRDVDVPFTYQYAVNGIAAVLTAEEAREVAADPAVVSVMVDEERELHTDAGPQWIGADALWDATTELGLPLDIKGEGIVIGTIDTGISPGNRSFAETGDDGYTHTNPRGPGNYLGACDPGNAEQFDPDFPCNEKLIGAYVFGAANDSALDYDGHGSHTASTSGGNVVEGVAVETPTMTTEPFDLSGVAPHANVISYLGCCTVSGLTASINQAIADEVDVINYSIGSSSPGNPWADFDTIGFLNARAAGIFVATSNGNDGPLPATTGSPSSAPWLISVGASTHNRHNGNVLTDLTSNAGGLPDIEGKSVTGPLDVPAPLVYAGDVGDPLCADETGHEAEFAGSIVICDRGVVGRVQKSVNVAAQGAIGFVHINDEINGPSLNGDEFAIPGVHISYSDGQVLLDWLSEGDGHQAAIRGTVFEIDDARGDLMHAFSSRGPNRAMDVIVPHVTAPGVDILAALGADSYTVDIHGFISGTSMSSPHVAGAGALLTQARPDWTPAQMQSALMTTARDVRNHTGEPATPYAQGSGHVNVDAAVRAGLLFDETLANYVAANPADGGDPKSLNIPSFADSQCLGSCSWQRTATVPASAPSGVTWTASVESDDGLDLSLELSTSTVSPGDSLSVSVTAAVPDAETGSTLFGTITLTPSHASVPSATLPVAVVPVSGVLPNEVEVRTRRDAGSHVVTVETIEVTEFTGSVNGLVTASIEETTLVQDPTRDDPYDDLSQVDVYTVEVPEGSTRLVAEIIDFEMPDLDLFVGTGDAPSAATQVCASTSPSSAESCDVADPAAGTWWILIQNWQGTSPTAADAYTLAHAVVPGESLGNAGIDGPEGPVESGEPYEIRVHWDLDDTEPGDRWYGTGVLGTSPATPDDIGTFPITVIRAEDDVAKTASVDEAATGDTISYEITIQPNVTAEDLVYTITDTVPDGLTVDPDSVTGGGAVDGQTVSWEIDVPTPAGQTGEYVVSTPASSPQCADWSGFLDLAQFSIPLAGLDGDTTFGNAFSNIGPFEHYGEQFPHLTVAEDGLVTVAGGYGGSPWVPQSVPNPTAPNGVIAPLWSDLQLSLANDRGMRLATAGDAAVIQWDHPFEWGGDPTDPDNSVGKFQAWVYTTVEDFRPEITFEYDTLGALPSVATIGTESILGDLATAVLNASDPSAVLEEGGSFCLDYEGASFDPITLGYDVTVDEDATSGTYTNEAVHTTDDPYARPETATASVEVTGTDPEPECTDTITGQHTGPLTISDGTTCLDGAAVTGPVTVRPGAGLVADGARITGPVTAQGASEVSICDSRITGSLTVTSAASVTIGDPANGCAGNTVTGPVGITGSDGPSVIAGNRIVGSLTCSGNDPAPVNNGHPNTVIGPKSGQCSSL